MDCDAQLSTDCYMPIHAHLFFPIGDFDPKVGHTDLVLVCDQGSLVGLYARLQFSACSGYDLFHPGYHPDTHRQDFDQLIQKGLS